MQKIVFTMLAARSRQLPYTELQAETEIIIHRINIL